MSPENPKTAPAAKATPAKKSYGWIWFLLLLVVAGAAAYLWYPRIAEGQSKAQKSAKDDKAWMAGRPVPVIAALSRQGDMPVYLNGLGNVTAFNTVTVRSRVDGQIMKVAFTEGQLVKEGDLLIEIDPRPFQVQLAQAEAQKARDTALLQNALLDRERYKVLYTQEAIPKQQLDTQLATVAQIEATIKSDQAAIDNAKLQLVYCHITSPLTGRIGLRLVDQGNIVHATDTTGLVVITQLQPIAVLFNIAEDSLPAVRKKMQGGSLRVDAYDRDLKARLAQGKLLTIDNQIDQSTGTVRFKAQFENEDNSLFPNQFINARLLLDMRHNAVIIPNAAIQRSPQSAFVYVVKPDNTAEVRRIVTTLAEGDEAAVDSGLEPGEAVVIDGVDKLQQGTKVSVHMAAPKGVRG
ncbi:MAG TPA: MdtA/MuxA family multidrug efflux RND transporter periplasmic adaptor subunit [Bryobacteraceae bacterium]|nr:MdtA/MuxA family multidrug efflux RND transporter periplasmic adaptor subunit [Bryobacteraceae bacterium]